MKDRDFLIWVYERLHHQGDPEIMDYMHKLRAIIQATPEDQETRDILSVNNIEELQARLKEDAES